jgi:hypothetical protein
MMTTVTMRCMQGTPSIVGIGEPRAQLLSHTAFGSVLTCGCRVCMHQSLGEGCRTITRDTRMMDTRAKKAKMKKTKALRMKQQGMVAWRLERTGVLVKYGERG